MLSISQRIHKYQSHKAFLKLEDDLLYSLKQEGLLQGSYGAAFNELSYRITNIIELISLQFVHDDRQKEMLRAFSQNPDLFDYAKSKGLQTSTYLTFESKGIEARTRILGKIRAFLIADTKENTLFQARFDEIKARIAEILQIRYPKVFIDKDPILKEIDNYKLAK